MNLKKFAKFAPLLILALLVMDVMLALQIANNNTSNPFTSLNPTPTPETQITTTATPYPTATRYPLDLGLRTPGLIENIDLIAAPVNADDALAIIRLVVENGQVLDFQQGPAVIALGSCQDNLKHTEDRVCVDIAKTTPFIPGEVLGTIKIKWFDAGMLYREEGSGYFNGKTLTLTDPLDSGRVAGDSDTNTSGGMAVEGVVLVVVGAVVVMVAGIGIYLNMKKPGQKFSLEDYKKSDASTKMLISLGMFLLAGGAVFAAVSIANRDQTPEDSSALTPTPIYITITVTVTPKVTATTTLTATPSTTVTPTVSRTSTPASPMPTPFTDNVPVVCGALDVNDDLLLNYIDYTAMMVIYNHACTDVYPHVGCGGKDTNDDGYVDFQDFYYLMGHYYPNTVNCTRF